ncbi:hypothetical protein K435DRAFT_869497 [Dendrothele bispora CBS 962.96]|uniref:Uncharacterized protein n=1 Tax=Dendrothele bispora (strain CBS 962.96) TaxID=1314807 RepID=A0A4S8L928_DENBC|nr:hypothetical protein K435DRAFT_869497 [Dendrothele bispora CBS 962.96]
MSRFSEHSDSQSRNTRTIDELSQVQSMARSSPSTRFRLGRLHAAVQQADNSDNNLDRTEAFDAIADILLGYTSFSDDTEVFHDMVAALDVLVERLPDTHPHKGALYDHYGHALLEHLRYHPTYSKTNRNALDDAITAYHRCVELTPKENFFLVDRLQKLVDASQDRFVRGCPCCL